MKNNNSLIVVAIDDNDLKLARFGELLTVWYSNFVALMLQCMYKAEKLSKYSISPVIF